MTRVTKKYLFKILMFLICFFSYNCATLHYINVNETNQSIYLYPIVCKNDSLNQELKEYNVDYNKENDHIRSNKSEGYDNTKDNRQNEPIENTQLLCQPQPIPNYHQHPKILLLSKHLLSYHFESRIVPLNSVLIGNDIDMMPKSHIFNLSVADITENKKTILLDRAKFGFDDSSVLKEIQLTTQEGKIMKLDYIETYLMILNNLTKSFTLYHVYTDENNDFWYGNENLLNSTSDQNYVLCQPVPYILIASFDVEDYVDECAKSEIQSKAEQSMKNKNINTSNNTFGPTRYSNVSSRVNCANKKPLSSIKEERVHEKDFGAHQMPSNPSYLGKSQFPRNNPNVPNIRMNSHHSNRQNYLAFNREERNKDQSATHRNWNSNYRNNRFYNSTRRRFFYPRRYNMRRHENYDCTCPKESFRICIASSCSSHYGREVYFCARKNHCYSPASPKSTTQFPNFNFRNRNSLAHDQSRSLNTNRVDKNQRQGRQKIKIKSIDTSSKNKDLDEISKTNNLVPNSECSIKLPVPMYSYILKLDLEKTISQNSLDNNKVHSILNKEHGTLNIQQNSSIEAIQSRNFKDKGRIRKETDNKIRDIREEVRKNLKEEKSKKDGKSIISTDGTKHSDLGNIEIKEKHIKVKQEMPLTDNSIINIIDKAQNPNSLIIEKEEKWILVKNNKRNKQSIYTSISHSNHAYVCEDNKHGKKSSENSNFCEINQNMTISKENSSGAIEDSKKEDDKSVEIENLRVSKDCTIKSKVHDQTKTDPLFSPGIVCQTTMSFLPDGTNHHLTKKTISKEIKRKKCKEKKTENSKSETNKNVDTINTFKQVEQNVAEELDEAPGISISNPNIEEIDLEINKECKGKKRNKKKNKKQTQKINKNNESPSIVVQTYPNLIDKFFKKQENFISDPNIEVTDLEIDKESKNKKRRRKKNMETIFETNKNNESLNIVEQTDSNLIDEFAKLPEISTSNPSDGLIDPENKVHIQEQDENKDLKEEINPTLNNGSLVHNQTDNTSANQSVNMRKKRRNRHKRVFKESLDEESEHAKTLQERETLDKNFTVGKKVDNKKTALTSSDNENQTKFFFGLKHDERIKNIFSLHDKFLAPFVQLSFGSDVLKENNPNFYMLVHDKFTKQYRIYKIFEQEFTYILYSLAIREVQLTSFFDVKSVLPPGKMDVLLKCCTTINQRLLRIFLSGATFKSGYKLNRNDVLEPIPNKNTNDLFYRQCEDCFLHVKLYNTNCPNENFLENLKSTNCKDKFCELVFFSGNISFNKITLKDRQEVKFYDNNYGLEKLFKELKNIKNLL